MRKMLLSYHPHSLKMRKLGAGKLSHLLKDTQLMSSRARAETPGFTVWVLSIYIGCLMQSSCVLNDNLSRQIAFPDFTNEKAESQLYLDMGTKSRYWNPVLSNLEIKRSPSPHNSAPQFTSLWSLGKQEETHSPSPEWSEPAPYGQELLTSVTQSRGDLWGF